MSKKRAFVRYSKQGKIVPGSLIITSGSYPNGPSTWYEVTADLCCLISGEPGGDPGGDPDTPPSDGGTTLETRSITGTRAFVRYTKDGQIVPGSLIITNGTYPDNSAVWYEIQTNLCCISNTN